MEKLRRGQSDSNPAISSQFELLRARAVEAEDEHSKMDKRQNPDRPSRPSTDHARQTNQHVKPPTHRQPQNKQHNRPTRPHETTHTATNNKHQHRPNSSHRKQTHAKQGPQRHGSNQNHVSPTKTPIHHQQRPRPHPQKAAVQHKAPLPPPKAPPAPVSQPKVIPAVVPRPQNVPPAPVQQNRIIPPPQVAAPLPVGNQNPNPIPVPIVKPANTSVTAPSTLPAVGAIITPNNTATVPVQDVGKNTSQASNYATLAVQNGNNTQNSNATSPFADSTQPEKVWGQAQITEPASTGLSKAGKAVVIFCVPLGALILGAALYKLWKVRRNKRSRVDSVLVTRSRPTTISDVFGGREPEESSFGNRSAYQSMPIGSQPNSSFKSGSSPMSITVAMPNNNGGSDEKMGEKSLNQDKNGLIEPSLNVRGNNAAFIRHSEETGYEDSVETGAMGHDLTSNSGTIAIVARTFDPFLPDELVIHPGDRVRVEMVYDDGWCFGTNLDADRHRALGASEVVSTGVFPQDCLQRPTDNETVSDGSGPTGHASFVNTIHTFGKPEASSIECLDTTQQQPVRVVPRVNKVQNSSKGDQKGTSGTTKPLSDKPPRISSIIQDRDTQLFHELESALSP
ncbi:hypothetical protein DFH28DRAFT_576129 [Melampsora americana]|nr:hypothetical protein DFH28DRAFT_576129 [Melampsora americana]